MLHNNVFKWTLKIKQGRCTTRKHREQSIPEQACPSMQTANGQPGLAKREDN